MYMELKELMKRIDKVRSILKIQCSDGNWNYDPYMHGMANGMILMMAILEDKEPVYLSAPKEWLCERDGDFKDKVILGKKI